MPSRDELTLAWGDSVLATLPQRPKVRFGAGHFIGVDDGAATFALPNPMHRDRCEECRPEVESALERHFGRPVPLRLVVVEPGTPSEAVPSEAVPSEALPSEALPSEALPSEALPSEAVPPPVVAADDEIDLTDLRDAPNAGVASPVDQVMLAFEGAEVLEE